LDLIYYGIKLTTLEKVLHTVHSGNKMNSPLLGSCIIFQEWISFLCSLSITYWTESVIFVSLATTIGNIGSSVFGTYLLTYVLKLSYILHCSKLTGETYHSKEFLLFIKDTIYYTIVVFCSQLLKSIGGSSDIVSTFRWFTRDLQLF